MSSTGYADHISPEATDTPVCACGHSADEHVEILGCCYGDASKPGGGVKFECECGEFEMPDAPEEEAPDFDPVEAVEREERLEEYELGRGDA